MSRRLGGSLRHIYEQARSLAAVPDGMIDHFVTALESGKPASPEAFAVHSDILQAVADDDIDAVRRLLSELAGRSFVRDKPVIRPLSAAAFSATSRDRYLRYAATDEDVPLALTAPRDDEFMAFRVRLDEAFALLRRAAPELADELDAVVGEIVVATVDETANGQVFDGISVFDLWGAMFINPRRHATVLETTEVLVHEATHTLLFGYSLDEPLVLNPLTQRYASPVREDARPMDGVFHGTYVIAMLHYWLRRLIDGGVLSEPDRASALERIARYGEPFADGIGVIRDDGILTETGRRVIAGAEAYMSAALR